jgi:hypothetical protein
MLKTKISLACVYLFCVGVMMRDPYGLAGSEFRGGLLTGRILSIHLAGILIFVLAIMLAFISLRVSAIAGIVAGLLGLPLYLYFLVPIAFRWFPAEYSVHLQRHFAWNSWALEGVLSIFAAILVSAYILRSTPTNFQKSKG